MPRSILTLATLLLAPTMAFAFPVTPLPGSAELEDRPIGRQLIDEQRGAQCLRAGGDFCAPPEGLIFSARFGALEERAEGFIALRKAALFENDFLLSEDGPTFESVAENALVETPLPAAIFPMLLGLAGAALAMRLKNPAAQRG